MKTWQIFTIGLVVLIATFFLPMYQHLIAGTTAVIVVAMVGFGFLLQPTRAGFIIHTKVPLVIDGDYFLEHNQIAVKVELTRLWLLFVPTFIAVGFLVATAVQGKTWRFALLDWADEGNPMHFYMFRALLFFVVGLLSAWISERWVLMDGKVGALRSLRVTKRHLSYAFVDDCGSYYGGEGVMVTGVRSRELAGLVLYRAQHPDQNKIPATCMFHRFVIVAQGLTDLDAQTATNLTLHAARAKMTS